ncbi:hypothetical protein EK21DRAFT_94714 [Setomelanomma holmii]|uniref:Uncharacterized protein n=1 Tax=Setomelanomma holmii TaxID=210430 RepID=A0A9P4LFZ6_9PLEO|nr:hypothetical protein EK21DRAFT_94714 [Setomelanomma holmii]
MSDVEGARITSDRMARAQAFDACRGCSAQRLPATRRLTKSPVFTEATILPVAAYRLGAIQNNQPRGVDHPIMLIHEREPLLHVKNPLPIEDPRNTYDPCWMQRSRDSLRHQHVPPVRDEFADEETFQRIVDADRAIRSAVLRRRFMRLDSRHVGVGPGLAHAGDEVMVFYGARTPFVVRKLSQVPIEGLKGTSWQTVWTVIGECYVIGVMDGEVIEHNERSIEGPETVFLI